jgi:integrase/recombinase XerD
MHIQNAKNIDKEIIEMFIDHLKEKGVSDIYVNTNLRNLKPFFTWLTENGYIEINPFTGIKLLKTDKKRKQILSNEDLQAILKQIDLLSFAGVRDWLMIQVLYGCALRISECCSLKLKDVDLEKRTIYIENSKNREDSFIPFPESLVKPLKKYIKQHFYNMPQDSYLFPNLYGERLSRETFLKNLKRYGKKAGIPHVTCHLLRHSFAVNCLLNGASTATVRRLLRHRDLKTVEEYIHWLPKNVQEQFDKFNPLDQMYLNPS